MLTAPGWASPLAERSGPACTKTTVQHEVGAQRRVQARVEALLNSKTLGDQHARTLTHRAPAPPPLTPTLPRPHIPPPFGLIADTLAHEHAHACCGSGLAHAECMLRQSTRTRGTNGLRTVDGGSVVGSRLGARLGAAVGPRLGDPDGCSVGDSVGCIELYSAAPVGASDGVSDGNADGPTLGVPVGRALGACMPR